MDYRRLGASGLKVPALSFGTGTFGEPGLGIAGVGWKEGGEKTADKGQDEHQNQRCVVRHSRLRLILRNRYRRDAINYDGFD